MRPSRTAARITAVAMTAVLTATALAGCGIGEAESILHRSTLRIGVKADQPGLGLRKQDGTFDGFDVEVATYVAGKLGFTEKEITFVETPSGEREKALGYQEPGAPRRERTVDMVVATYSITADRKTKVTFAGPYYVAHQDTLVGRENADGAGDDIKNVRDLGDRNRRLCKVEGSTSWQRIVDERGIAAKLVSAPSYSACVDKLLKGELEAVSTDDLILAGFAARYSGRVKVINAPISDEKYGIGLPKGDLDACERINTALTEMYQDGTAGRLLEKWFHDTGLELVRSVPQFEGCG